MPALRGLAAAFPGHHRVLAAPAWLAPLARHTGTVHEVADTAELAPVAPHLHGADVAVNLHGRGPQSTAVLAATRPGRLVAFDLPGLARWDDGEHERHRWCRLLASAGVDADPDDVRLARPDVAVPEAAVGATVVHPGASTEARRWPAVRWAEVAAAERAAGRTVVVTGSAAEADLARQVAAQAGLAAGAVLAGRTGLLDLLALVADAGRVVSGDTGVAHVATAMGTPSVVLFGPTSPAAWGPPASPLHRVLWAGRTGDPHGPVPDAGLLRITPDDVRAALDALPEEGRATERAHPTRGGPPR